MVIKTNMENGNVRNNRNSNTERGNRAARIFRNNSGSDSADSGISNGSSGSESGSGNSASGSSGSERGSSAIEYTITGGGNTSIESGNEDRESNSSVGSIRDGRRRRGRPRKSDSGSGRHDNGNGSVETFVSSDTERPSDINGEIPNIGFAEIFSNEPATEKKRRGRPRKDGASVSEVSNLADLVSLGYKLLPVVASSTIGGTLEEYEYLELNKFEAEEWCRAFIKASGSVSNQKLKQLLRTIEKVTPWVTLALITYSINMPRLQMTLDKINERKARNLSSDDSGNHPSSTNASGTQSDNTPVN